MDSLTSSISEHVQRSLNGIIKYLKHMKLVPSNAVITAHALKVMSLLTCISSYLVLIHVYM